MTKKLLLLGAVASLSITTPLLAQDESKYTSKDIAKMVITSEMISVETNDKTFPENCWSFTLHYPTNKPYQGIDRMWVDMNNNGKFEKDIDIPVVFDPSKADPQKPTAAFKLDRSPVRKDGSTITIYGPFSQLEFADCKVTKIETNDNPYLTRLDISRNKLTAVDLSRNWNLAYVNLWANDLQKVILCPQATYVDVYIFLNKMSADALIEMVKTMPDLNGKPLEGTIWLYQVGDYRDIDPYGNEFYRKEGNKLPRSIFAELYKKHWVPMAWNGTMGKGKFDENGKLIGDNGEEIPVELKAQKLSNEREVTLYPTYSSETITVSFPQTLLNREYRIYNLAGSLVEKGVISSPSLVLSIKDFPQGAYLFVTESLSLPFFKIGDC